MALAPLVKGASGRRPVLDPGAEFVVLCSMVRFTLAKDSARFNSEGKNLAKG
jgi:hypothetical protein